MRTEPHEPPGLLVGSDVHTVGRVQIKLEVEQCDQVVVGVGDEAILNDKWEGATYLGRGQLCMFGKQVAVDARGAELNQVSPTMACKYRTAMVSAEACLVMQDCNGVFNAD